LFQQQLDADHLAKKDVQQTLSSMNELANYLNESQRHKDILDQIDKLMVHLNDFGSQQLKDYGHFIKVGSCVYLLQTDNSHSDCG
jgi:hypothetical protein